MTNTPILFRPTFGTWSGAVFPSDVAELNVLSVSGAEYSVMFIVEASGSV